jgi:L-alanine-DL-glutamate epimerase-like enolase superfamily enzyme
MGDVMSGLPQITVRQPLPYDLVDDPVADQELLRLRVGAVRDDGVIAVGDEPGFGVDRDPSVPVSRPFPERGDSGKILT